MDYLNIQKPVLPLLKATEKVLARHIGSEIRLISELRQRTPVAKGKKIRAAFLFLLAGMNRTKSKGLPVLGAAIEMLHLSSLVHDDIIDHSSWRRGEKTPNHHFGDCLSVLWGDFLFITSIRMLTRGGGAAAIDMLAEASRQMIEGQILEFENNFNYRIQPRTYYNIIRKKTSSMFAGIAALAARLAGKDAASAANFYRFGQDFGMIFQISDDLLDLFSDRAGKSRFQDLKEGKVTLPYILLLQGGGLPLVKGFDRPTPGPLLARCRDLGIQERSLAVIDRYHRKCSRFLRSFPPSPYRSSLESLLEFVRYREY
ncbi:MAG: polyprenyl synthetase family protein [Candidatus Aminicenantes bacterium]|nr:polyprenyl synthetase family protein [Candidatus Aminicenantes bacterium]